MKRKWLLRILRYCLGLLLALLILWGFYSFIKDDNWLAVTSLATLVLAIAAFLAIWQNRSLQIRERRERLLNEIIEWAVSISKWRIENKSIFREMTRIEDPKQKQRLLHAHIAEAEQSFIGMQGRNLYLNNVVQTFDQNLQKAAAKLVSDMEAYTDFLDGWGEVVAAKIGKNLMDEKTEKYEKADAHMEALEESADKVIEEATKIKTKDIG